MQVLGRFVLSMLLSGSIGVQAAETVVTNEVEPETVGMDSARFTEITALLEQVVNDGLVAGVVAGVARDGKVVYLQSRGWQDIARQQPMREDSIFQIRSMSKPLTAVAVLQLIEQGKLDLQDPVSKYIPHFAYMFVFINPDEPFLSAQRKPSREITIEDLLLNTAGLSHRNDALYQQRRVRSRGEPLEQLVIKMAAVPLMNDPGTKWRYSESLTVLGRVVEIVSGLRLDRYMQENIFQPLQMPDCGFYVTAEQLDRLTQVYDSTGDGSPLAPAADMDVPITQNPPLLEGSAGMVCTVPDYLHFLQALLNGGELNGARILQDATVAEMTRNHIPAELLPIATNPESPMLDRGWGYGIGVVIDKSKSEFGVNDGEFGWNGSLGTFSWADPQTGTVAILMLQIQPSSAQGLPGKFKNLVYQSIIE